MELLAYTIGGFLWGVFLGWEIGHSQGFSKGEDKGYKLCRESFDDIINLGAKTRDIAEKETLDKKFFEKYASFDDWFMSYKDGFSSMYPDAKYKHNKDELMALYNERRNPRILGVQHGAELSLNKT